MVTKVKADLLIIGMGAVAEMAALYAYDADPELKILIATKALRGKGGCSRMVQGGFNVVLNPGDSHEKHFMDTLKGGQYINDQDLAVDARGSRPRPRSRSWKRDSAASSTAIPTAPSTRRPSRASRSTAPCTRATSRASRSSAASPSR